MFRLSLGPALAVAALAGCTLTIEPTAPPPEVAALAPVSADRAAENFVTVVERVAPVAEQVCREEAYGRRCDYVILIDDRPGAPSNAYQTEDRNGRPVIVFTLPLIAEAQNQDELAFILGHEAAHHIEGHLVQSKTNANLGALVLGNIAAAYGYDDAVIETAAAIGAEVGARQYSKAYELEADALGAVIARRAGYDPVLGAAYFARIPDPGDQFLGTHPPNSERQEVVRRAAGGTSG